MNVDLEGFSNSDKYCFINDGVMKQVNSIR